MRIAIFSTNTYPTPPINEKVVYAPIWLAHYLAEGLKKKGHQVSLFASSDSTSKVKIISHGLISMAHNKKWTKTFENAVGAWKMVLKQNYELLLATELIRQAQEHKFDIIQFHSMHHFIHFSRVVKIPVCYSIHDPLNYPVKSHAVKRIYETFNEQKVKNAYIISLSNAQRKPLPNLNYIATVYNGIDTELFSFSPKQGKYLAFAGRIIPGKGLHIAVKVAQKTKLKLKIAGPIMHKKYWEKKIKPHLSRNITYQGMINQKEMVILYQKAKAFLMPTLLEESFGLVVAEAMSCGTPAIGFDNGAVREVINHGKTGFVVNNEREMIKAVKKIDKIKREECRKWVTDNFSLQAMIDGYEKVYLKILKKHEHSKKS